MIDVPHKCFCTVLVYVNDGACGIDDTIRSVINQTIGLGSDSELVLLLDENDDSDSAICSKYTSDYSESIRVFHLPNVGLLAAYGYGIRQSRGDYVSLLRAGMSWHPSALGTVRAFLKAHPDIGIVSARMRGDFIGADYRFTKTRVVNIFEEQDAPQLSPYAMFVRKQILENGQITLSDASDEYAIASRMILRIGMYALLKECECEFGANTIEVFHASSANRMQVCFGNSIATSHQICYASKSLYGHVVPYAQYAAMHMLKCAMLFASKTDIPEDDGFYFRQRVENALANISDEVILRQRKLSVCWKLYILSIKHACTLAQIQERLRVIGKKVFYDSIALNASDCVPEVVIDSVDNCAGGISIGGRIITPFSRGRIGLQCKWGSETQSVNLCDLKDTCFSSAFKDEAYPQIGFFLELPAKGSFCMAFSISVDDRDWRNANIGFSPSSHMPGKLNECYMPKGDGRLWVVSKHELGYERIASALGILRNEFRIAYGLIKTRGVRGAIIAARRCDSMLFRIGRNQRIWLISDDLMHAGRYGEDLFRYICLTKPYGVKAYYVLSRRSPEFKRIKAIGSVVAKESMLYKKLFLCAEYIISSSQNRQTIHCFGSNEEYYMGVYRWKYVLLCSTKDKSEKEIGCTCFDANTRLSNDRFEVSTCAINGFRTHCLTLFTVESGFDSVIDCLFNRGLK